MVKDSLLAPVAPEARESLGPSPYIEFRRQFIAAKSKKLRGLDAKDITRLCKLAWKEKKEKELKKLKREREMAKKRKREEKLATPYALFRSKHMKNNKEQYKDRSASEITEEVKKAWRETTPYMKFRLQYLIDHRGQMRGKKETEITAEIKERFKAKRQAELEKKKRAKKRKTKKVAKKKTPKKKGRKKDVLLSAFPNKHKLKPGELLSPYVYFRAGFFVFNNKVMRGKSRKEQTALVKAAWKKQQDDLVEARRIFKVKEQARKRRCKAKKAGRAIRPGDEKIPRGKMSAEELKERKKNVITPYQYFRVGYARLHGLDIANNPKEHTKDIKAAWDKCKQIASVAPKVKPRVRKPKASVSASGADDVEVPEVEVPEVDEEADAASPVKITV